MRTRASTSARRTSTSSAAGRTRPAGASASSPCRPNTTTPCHSSNRSRRAGVVVAIGHTAATPARIREAVRAGARLSTHLGNGSHAVLPRHENYLWEQLADDGLWASVIADGHHLPPAILRSILRVKTPARVVLTCDASSLAGLPPGRYAMWGQELEILPTGRVVVPGTPFLAGSGVFLDACVRHLLGLGEVSLADALDMAGARPRRTAGAAAPSIWCRGVRRIWWCSGAAGGSRSSRRLAATRRGAS